MEILQADDGCRIVGNVIEQWISVEIQHIHRSWLELFFRLWKEPQASRSQELQLRTQNTQNTQINHKSPRDI